MAFPAPFLDELAARNPIEDVVSGYVALTRRGSNLFGLCPFHNEKTPSFSVAPDKQMYYCFGCGKGGGVVNFIMEAENLSYPDAVRFLAQRAGMEVPEDDAHREDYRRRERLYALCREAARYFHAMLSSPAGEPGRAYAAQRGLSQGCITRFGLGFAPEGWNGLRDAMRARGYDEQELLDAGLAVRSPQKNNVYDKFRNRLMFPIIDVRGNVIGFGGRVMGQGEPKYLNSPETEIFSKRRNLFALNIAKKTKRDYLILTEGYMDAITLHQYGFDCAVASLGTSLTEQHANLLGKYTRQLILTYDGDSAGQNASQRAIRLLEKTNIQVRVLRMTGAKDPDEYLHKFGAERFAKLLEGAENQVAYRLQSLQSRFDLGQDDQRVAFARAAADLVASLPGAVEREVYGARAAEAAGMSAAGLMTEVERLRRQKLRQEKRQQEKVDLAPMSRRQPKIRGMHYEDEKSAQAEEQLLAQVMREPGLFDRIDLGEEEFSAPLLGRAYAALRSCWQQGRQPGMAALEAAFSPEELSHLTAVLARWDQTVDDRAVQDCVDVIRGRWQARNVNVESSDDNMQYRKDIMQYRKYLQEKKGLGG